MMARNIDYSNIPDEKFRLADKGDTSHDIKLETKPVGYFRDAFNRFQKNKASVVAAVIICVLVLFAILGPFATSDEYVKSYQTETFLVNYKYLTPRLSVFDGTGFWDGSKVEEVSQARYNIYRAMELETGHTVIENVISKKETTDAFGRTNTLYTVRVNTYYSLDTMVMTLTPDKYADLQRWQDENGVQVILPMADNEVWETNPNVWFVSEKNGSAILDENGNFQPSYATTGSDAYTSKMRLENDPYNSGDTENCWRYAKRTGTADKGYNYIVRINPYNYFIYKYGFEPSFVFGTDAKGYDVFSRLASGARFSLVLAVFVSLINLVIGAFYGAVEGYYGGVIDILLERISDILAGVPFIVVATLFRLHLASKVGMIPSLLFAFVLTGWISIAARVRMQFYRFKNQEYVLAARTLGAGDFRIMFKHIFPNSLGTIITSSVLIIPGVIFSETSLSYLGIINLDSSTMSSVGSMLSAGQSCMTVAPHVVLFPAIFIGLLEISFNLFGNGLRDAFNPSLRGTEE